MVINVGLLVNDKINLQNSVDIAAYYAAMKQAEVLNTMAHVNFQMRQAWKLLNWRIWALGDIGRFPEYINGDVSSATDVDSDPKRNLNICTRNIFWRDELEISGNKAAEQNFCKNADFTIPAIRPLRLTGVQTLPIFSFMQVFRSQSERNAGVFNNDCEKGAGFNYFYAASILASYKLAVANRKGVMRELQRLLIESNDFKDIMGASVRATTENVFKKNLTLANKESISGFDFYNSLDRKPFLVPVNVRLRLTYTDMFSEAGACKGKIKDILDKPVNENGLINRLHGLVNSFAQVDYGSDITQSSAKEFAAQNKEADFLTPTSTIGFEKNPWVLAYVKVKAQTKPKMLFSPIGNAIITLNAEAYAMPFGGRIGPWYNTNWPNDLETSTSGEQTDKLLPPRVGEAFDTSNPKEFLPNYSRFPGDKLGMASRLSRTQGLDELIYPANDIASRPSLFKDDYGNIVASLSNNQFKQDPLVFNSNPNNTKLRTAELIAVAPDLFDALYYSIQNNFEEEFLVKKSNGHLNKMFQIGIEDFGTNVVDKLLGKPQQNQKILQQAINIITQKHSRLFWKIKDANHLNTGWTQEAADRYLPLSGGPSNLIGVATDGGADGYTGGRVGYSVKLVSENYLRKPLKLGGAKVNAANIKNPPP